MLEDLAPPGTAAWATSRRRRRRWATAMGAFLLALIAVSGLYWVKNPPVDMLQVDLDQTLSAYVEF